MLKLRPIMTVLLIAIVANGAVSVPAWRHTHPLSDHSRSQGRSSTHSHGDSLAHSHSHDHSHPHSHSHESGSTEHAQDSYAQPGDHEAPLNHVHLCWFGFELTLPLSSDDSAPPPDSPGEWVPLVGEMVSPHVSAIPDMRALDRCMALETSLILSTPPRAEPFVPPKLSLLCDAARHERSGVLNI